MQKEDGKIRFWTNHTNYLQFQYNFSTRKHIFLPNTVAMQIIIIFIFLNCLWACTQVGRSSVGKYVCLVCSNTFVSTFVWKKVTTLHCLLWGYCTVITAWRLRTYSSYIRAITPWMVTHPIMFSTKSSNCSCKYSPSCIRNP